MPQGKIRTCPNGHAFPETEFKAYIKLDVEDIKDAVIFDCPGGVRGHQFTLRKAVASNMFTLDEANKLANAAYREREQQKKGGS
jgi:hypothetical protein